MSMTGVGAADHETERGQTAVGTSARAVVESAPLGGGPLARLALDRSATSWSEPVPSSPAAWSARAAAIRAQFSAGAWLDLLLPALDPSGRAADRLERVAGGAGVVVTTGQQPGLFGGPLYTISKALTALSLADALEPVVGVPVAPIFWAATDDADFAEASYTVVSGTAGATELRAAATAPDGTPMSAVPLGSDVEALRARLEQACGSAAYTPALYAVRDAYVAGATVGGAYVSLLRRLLEPLGIAVLDASHPAAREAGFHVLRRALLAARDLEISLADRSSQIVAAGLAPQVSDVASRSLVFRYDADGRKARIAIPDARALVQRVRPHDVGPNVLLRPVVERSIMPTVAYAAGPGELGYFAQVSAVAETLGAAQPLAVPRWSGVVIEPQVQRILDRHGLAPGDLAVPHAVEGALARAAMPGDVHAALDALRAAVADGIERVERVAELGGVDAAVVAGAGRGLSHRLERLERRFVAAAKRRNDSVANDIATARGSLYPLGKRQERALNAIPLLARHGETLLNDMRRAATRHAEALIRGDAAQLLTATT